MTATDIDSIHQTWGGHAAQDIGGALGRYARTGLWPSKVEDPGDPPGWTGGRGGDLLDFEALLGRYDPDTATVTLWQRGIAHAAALLGVDPRVIDRIVDLHEHAHALHHRGIGKVGALPAEVDGLLRQQEVAFRAMTLETGEQVAQLATLVALRRRRDRAEHLQAREALDAMVDAFFRLMDRQSRPYRLPPETRTMALPRLQAKLGLLVDMTDAMMSPSADHIRRILD